jgi:hypothetical protein
MKLPKAVLTKMIKLGFIEVSESCSAEEQHKFGYYRIQEDARDADGFRLFVVKRNPGTHRLYYVPLHPEFDKYAFTYVDGCFYPILMSDTNKLTTKDVVYEYEGVRTAHPNYPFYV